MDMKVRLRKRTRAAIIMAVVVSQAVTISAHATQRLQSVFPPRAQAQVQPITVSQSSAALDFRELSRLAKQRGDTRIAELFEQKANGHESRGWISWIRKGAVWELRNASDKVPAKIRPYAHKIADVLEQTEEWEKAGLAAALIQAGVPPTEAYLAADWIVTIFG